MESQVADLRWRKSSYSGNGGAECVEVGQDQGMIVVRDTKARGRGHLAVEADAWRSFIEAVKARTLTDR